MDVLLITIGAIVIGVFLIYCICFLLDRAPNLWYHKISSSKRKKIEITANIAIPLILLIAVLLGIHYEVLNWGALVIPALYLIPLLWGIVVSVWESRKEAGMNLASKGAANPHDVMMDALLALGCQPQANKDGSIEVNYQGENFHMEFGGMYARVWDPMWAGIKADDPDMPKIREAVNATNFNFGPTVVMTKPDEEGVIGFHTRRDIMLHPACPDNEPFVKAVLDSFFDAKEEVRRNFQQINLKHAETEKSRRPVGFNTNNQTK